MIGSLKDIALTAEEMIAISILLTAQRACASSDYFGWCDRSVVRHQCGKSNLNSLDRKINPLELDCRTQFRL